MKYQPFFSLCLIFSGAAQLPAVPADVLLLPVDGKPQMARLLGSTADGDWEFAQGAKGQEKIILAPADFIRWGQPAATLAGPSLFLTGGSCLVADEAFTQLKIKNDHLQFDSRSLGENIRIPLQLIEGVVLKPNSNKQQKYRWIDQVRARHRDHDLVVMENGDRLSGTLIELSESELTLQTDAENPLKLPRKNVRAIAFQPALLERPNAPDRSLMIQLADGSSLRAVSWNGNTDRVYTVTPTDLKFTVDLKIDSSQPNLIGLLPVGFGWDFLSEREPAAYRHTPFLSLKWPYHRDRNVLGDTLQIDGIEYEKGIGMHADSELTYRLNSPWKRLEGLVGIDDTARHKGSVIFQVELERDDAGWQTAFTSRVLRGGEPPEAFSLSLDRVQRIRLKTLHADGGAVLDRANWVLVRLMPAN